MAKRGTNPAKRISTASSTPANRPDAAEQTEPTGGADLNCAPARSPYEIAEDLVEKREAIRKHRKANEQAQANSRIIVELGDGTVLFRDGNERPIERVGQGSPLVRDSDRGTFVHFWQHRLAEIMAVRNCQNYSVRLSEHFQITLNQKFREERAKLESKGALKPFIEPYPVRLGEAS